MAYKILFNWHLKCIENGLRCKIIPWIELLERISVLFLKYQGQLKMNEYKVEKDRFFIKVYFSNGTIMEGNIFLSLHAAHHEGHESVKELLNQKEQFIPMAFIEGSMRLINKSHIMMVSFPPSEKKVELLPFANIYEVIIYLVNHTLLNGRVSFLLPGYSCRTRDFLNQADSFLELRTDKEIYLINKGFITCVEEKTAEKRGNTWTLKSY